MGWMREGKKEEKTGNGNRNKKKNFHSSLLLFIFSKDNKISQNVNKIETSMLSSKFKYEKPSKIIKINQV